LKIIVTISYAVIIGSALLSLAAFNYAAWPVQAQTALQRADATANECDKEKKLQAIAMALGRLKTPWELVRTP